MLLLCASRVWETGARAGIAGFGAVLLFTTLDSLSLCLRDSPFLGLKGEGAGTDALEGKHGRPFAACASRHLPASVRSRGATQCSA